MHAEVSRTSLFLLTLLPLNGVSYISRDLDRVSPGTRGSLPDSLAGSSFNLSVPTYPLGNVRIAVTCNPAWLALWVLGIRTRVLVTVEQVLVLTEPFPQLL